MLTLALCALLGPPLAASCLAAIVRPYQPLVGRLTVAGAAVSLAAASWLSAHVVSGRPAEDLGPGTGLWRIDALSALVALCIAFVVLLAAALGPITRADTNQEPAPSRRFYIYTNALAFTMLLAVTVQNVALMWVAIEATTIASALAIPLHRTRASVEASWKYILVCSVGIALAFTGTILAYVDFVTTAGEVPGALNWSVLRASAPSLHPELLQLAFAFLLVGYGTKAGLAPMHTWLPDAHSESPPQVSALMSGVLLAVALYAIARWKAVVDGAVDPVFTSTLLLGFGLASVAIGVFSLVIQRHYKRMLAYSSVEHVGLVAIGLGLGPLGTFAAWLHVVNHAVAKSTSFLLAGRIMERYRSSDIAAVTGLLRTMPWTGGLFATAILALVGVPPFGLFVSEFLLIRAAVLERRWWLTAMVLLLLLAAFVSLLGHLNRMLYGGVPAGVEVGERRRWPIAVLIVPAALMVLLGLVLPAPLAMLIEQSVRVLVP